MVNLPLISGVFPDIFKTSHGMSLLKKPSLSKDDMKNYRPVSNLNFVSKIIEKVIANRIRSHLERNDQISISQLTRNFIPLKRPYLKLKMALF